MLGLPGFVLAGCLVAHDLPSTMTPAACRRPRVAAAVVMSKKSRREKNRAKDEPALKEVCDDRGCRFEAGPELGGFDLGLDDSLPAGLDLQEAADSGNLLLPTPAAYEELLASRAEAGVVTVLRYGAPWCHSCRRIGPQLQELAAERWPAAGFYELSGWLHRRTLGRHWSLWNAMHRAKHCAMHRAHPP